MQRWCLLLCFLPLLRFTSALVQNLQLDPGPGGARLVHPPFLSEDDRAPAPLSVDLPDDPIEDHFLLDTGSYDEEPGASLQLSGRSMRVPRRCILHQQSCLGVPKLPCCDPCDQCYCRFFNAFCYCRRVGHACSPRSP
ncbi:agouti-related protein [Boleophthalmus pectinirostris]|uniref:agouti-related protein n=1 Tax=Boleophthalmus pectinirostris TaxID=150288 RepID=UPI00242CA9C5|nr:agouti-related protein [Boleophthalmus pectinirostris]